ncbi:hypothetical protein I5I61_22610 [Pseudomonas nitroreducens]|uniref:Uncharacterized protein n=1 Tax=Pseudomonas nitroreducens TaxID=46680 RepID=A0ABS0KQB0_PSENT|nr:MULTISPECIES: hypothetical protein [Pseudomonas aeruginosa group]MBG6290257.1 hypothetical protein [Pseudomonas nitroreducens]TXR33164.1 hypothetical protein FVE88_22050 [Pseudomonas mendocina]HBP5530671.1 hypothetical protein [Pseudomonas aeruginosa]
MDSLFASLSPEELYEHLQSMDDVEKSVRLVRNSLLLPPLSNVYKLLHTSREAVWDGMRAEMPFLPVAKTISKAWDSPGARLGRSASIRMMRAAQGRGMAGVLSEFLDLDYLWPPGNEWAGLFASDFFSQDISKKFWIGFVKEAMHLNAIELHPDLGRLRQWEVYAHSPTVNRYGCPAMREALFQRIAVLSSDKEAELDPTLDHVHVVDTFAVLMRLLAWCVADLTIEFWEQVEQDEMAHDIPLQELIPAFDEVAKDWSSPMQSALDRLAKMAGWQQEQKATRFLGQLWGRDGGVNGVDSRIRLLRYWVKLEKGRPDFKSFLELSRVIAAEKLRSSDADKGGMEQFAWYQAVILRVAETLSHVRLGLSRKGYSTSELSVLMSIYQQEFRTARDLLGKPIPLTERAV